MLSDSEECNSQFVESCVRILNRKSWCEILIFTVKRKYESLTTPHFDSLYQNRSPELHISKQVSRITMCFKPVWRDDNVKYHNYSSSMQFSLLWFNLWHNYWVFPGIPIAQWKPCSQLCLGGHCEILTNKVTGKIKSGSILWFLTNANCIRKLYIYLTISNMTNIAIDNWMQNKGKCYFTV